MPENTASSLFVIIVLSSLIIMGISTFQASIFNNYGVQSDDLEYLNRAANVSSDITNLKDKIEETSITEFDPLDLFFSGVYNSLKLIFSIGDIYSNFLVEIGSLIGVPGWLISGAISLVMVVIVFAIIQMIVKYRS